MRVTINMPDNVVLCADKLAQVFGLSRSSLIVLAIMEKAKRESINLLPELPNEKPTGKK